MSIDSLKISGRKIAFRSSGSGQRTIVFLHGASMSSATWLPQLNDNLLGSTYRMIAMDLPGHGTSDRNEDPEGYTLAAFSASVTSLIKTLELNEFILVGLSYGSTVIGEITPPLKGCKGIMIVSPFIMNREITPDKIFEPNPLGHLIFAEDPSDKELRDFISSITTDNGVAESFYNSYRKTDPALRKALGQMLMSGAWNDQLKNLQNWQVPVCIVFGENDALVKGNYLDHFAAWNGKPIVIQNAGHVSNEENAKVFNDLLTRFVSDVFGQR